MTKSITAKLSSTMLFLLAGILLLVLSIVAWWKLIYTSPSVVFDRMLSNNFSTTSVIKTVTQADEAQKLNQTTLIVTEPKQRVDSISTLSQHGEAKSVVTTRSIGTNTEDFVSYTSINTNQKKADGKPFDFAGIIGVWGKSDQDNPAENGQLYNQTALGIVPTGNLALHERKELLKQIKSSQVYSFNNKTVKKSRVNGRPVLSYDVSVAPQAYVSMLKAFARSSGIKQLEQVDPTQYADSAPLKFKIDIDVWSGQLSKITYNETQNVDVFSAYGARKQVTIPTSTISINELQTRLQKIR